MPGSVPPQAPRAEAPLAGALPPRARRAIVVLVGIAVITAAIVLGTARLFPAQAPGGTPVVVGPHPLEGRPAPDFTLELVGGFGNELAQDGRVRLAALRGRPVIVNFWAPSCLPCRAEFPALRAALEAHRASGLVVLGVWFRGGGFLDSDQDVIGFMAERDADWPALADRDGLVREAWDVVVPPTTFFVDRWGVVRAVQLGEMTPELLERQLTRIP